MSIIEFIILIIIFSPVLIWGLWMWWAYRKKKKKLFVFQIIILSIGLIYATWKLEIFPGSSSYYERQYNKELTGQSFTTDEIVYEHHSERDFNGDGYSISVYSLDEEVASLFLNPQPTFFKDYPKKPEYRTHWKSKHWDRSLLKQNEQKYLDFAMYEIIPRDKDKAKKLQEVFDYVQKIMKQEGLLYAYNYTGSDADNIGNIDFFIIAPKEKRLIIMNLNT